MAAHAELVEVCLADESGAAGAELGDDGCFEGGVVGCEKGGGACCRLGGRCDVVFYSEGEGGGG